MIGAIIQARMSSSRLPGKVLREINGRPMIAYMLERVASAKRIDKVVLATSIDPSDDPIAEFCRGAKFACSLGSLDDVLDRYYQAARESKADVIVRLTGDCPLIDPAIIDEMIGIYEQGKYDYVANTVPPEGVTFPDGMDVEIFSFKNLEKAWKEAKKPSDREHVTFYFWKHPEVFSCYRHNLAKNLSHYRLTVDYPEDLEVISKIFAHFHPKNILFSMDDVIDFLERHPEIRKNKDIGWNQGWKTALDKDKKAGFTG